MIMRTVKKIKMVGFTKKIDWNSLVKEELKGLTQQELAERCKVSQQSISNWKNRTRNPGIYAKQELFKLAQKKGIDLSKYEIVSPKDAIKRQLAKSQGKELVRIFELYQKMSRSSKIKLLKCANTLGK